jgi:hypothetical protein
MTITVGKRVYAKTAVQHRPSGTRVIHKGGKGTVVSVLGNTPYVRWDWTGDTFPADARQLGTLGTGK